MTDPDAKDADLSLAAACAAGDAAAWERLVALQAPRVTAAVRTALVRRGVRDPALEADLVADVFAAAAEDGARLLRGFRGDAGLGTFLSVIASRQVSRALRRRAVEARAKQVIGSRASDEAPAASPAGRAETAERAAIVAGALDGLRERDRLLLTLFYVDGRSYKEVAAALGLAPGSVGTELARARVRVAEKLRAAGLGESEE